MQLSVVIPAHNEEGNLASTVTAVDRTLTEASIDYEILVVDDHSTDATPAVLKHLMQHYPALRVVANERARGFGHAIQTGLDAYDGDAVCLMMADGSDDPQDIVAYYRKLAEGYDCVFGSRFMRGSKVVNYPILKLVLNRLANLLIQFLFGIPCNDITNAFKAYRRSTIEGLRPILSHHFNITVELPLKAIVRGYSYAVNPIRWYGRVVGISKLRIREMGSRYLFILLYALLEKFLSRGDYVRRTAGAAVPELPAPRSMLLPWLAFAVVAAAHMVFLKTYPLNDLGGDAPGYWYLLQSRRSNLCAAPGYPFLAGFPVGLAARMAALFPISLPSTLLVAQHLFDLACMAVLMVVLARVYNRLTAVIAIAVLGLSLQALGVTSSVYPEWLQADLLILAFCFACVAWRADSFPRKAFWYALSFAMLTWSYFTKFNVLVFLPGLLLLIALEKRPWTVRVKLLAAATAFAFLNWALFVGLHHRPKTGTMDLSYDHSWVLMTKLEMTYDGRLPHPEGIATKRWLALSSVLPPTYGVASVGIFDNVTTAPPEARVPYRRAFGHLLTADHRTLDDVLRRHSLPEGFALGVSSIPISWHIGLKESDQLGIQVFRESILHRPGPYLKSVKALVTGALLVPNYYPLFPTADNLAAYDVELVPVSERRARVDVRSNPRAAPYRYSEPFIWLPGYRFFSWMRSIGTPQRKVAGLLLFGVIAASILAFVKEHRFQAVTAVVLSTLLFGFVVASCAVLEYRWKEARLAQPVVAILIGIALGWTIPQLFRTAARIREAVGRRRPPVPSRAEQARG